MGTMMVSYRITLYAGITSGDGESGSASLFHAYPVSAQEDH